MLKLNKTLIGLSTSAFILLSGGLAIALDTDKPVFPMDRHTKNSCEHAIIAKTPNGRKDLTFGGVEQQSNHVSIVDGTIKTKLHGEQWSKIRWTCRIEPKRGKVIRVEFHLPTSSSRLMAAAAYLR